MDRASTARVRVAPRFCIGSGHGATAPIWVVRMRHARTLKCYQLPPGSFSNQPALIIALALRWGGKRAARSMLPFKALPKQVFEVNAKLDADANRRVQLNADVSLDRWFPQQRLLPSLRLSPPLTRTVRLYTRDIPHALVLLLLRSYGRNVAPERSNRHWQRGPTLQWRTTSRGFTDRLCV